MFQSLHLALVASDINCERTRTCQTCDQFDAANGSREADEGQTKAADVFFFTFYWPHSNRTKKVTW